jgi:hypothetical protein
MANKKQTQKQFRFRTIISGNELTGTVVFSPAPRPGIFTALAEFEARRILNQMILDEMAAGRL